MCMTARRFKAEEVAPWGLVDRIVDGASLREAALELATEIAANAPLSLLATRATLRHTLVADVTAALLREHAAQAKLRPTNDYAEGVAAVFQRRAAAFTNS